MAADTPSTDRCYSYGMAGDFPVVGDWSGNGAPKIGVFRNGIGIWIIKELTIGLAAVRLQMAPRMRACPLE